ncbi:MAG: hypothetical protein KGI67_03990 [Pseudomonadota bacterium]|nr:hypothetical protein [Pseudomonadota bacterium]
MPRQRASSGYRGRAGVATLLAWLLAAAALLAPPGAAAYNLTPIYEETQDQLGGPGSTGVPFFLRPIIERVLDQFSDPAHEALTARMFGCTEAFVDCGDNPENAVPQGVLDGLRWNDNPIFRLASKSRRCPAAARPDYYLDLDSDPLCWVTLFYDAEKRASARPGEHFSGNTDATPVALLYRVHFGDLQFFHAMASWDGEAAAVTHAHVLAWLELTYRVNDGEIADLDAPISERIPALRDVFGRNGFSVRSLFVPQSHQHGANADALVRDMALGSLLHTIEDSWSAAHVQRDPASAGRGCGEFAVSAVPGRIITFHAYNHQDSNKHKTRDSSDTAESQLHEAAPVVAAGHLVLTLLQQHLPWADAAAYFQCLMEIGDPAAPAGPGDYAR